MSHAYTPRRLGVSASSIVHPGGHGAASLWSAVREGRSALRPNDLDWCGLPCWIGAVDGVRDTRLPSHLRDWDGRNNRLTHMALDDPAFRQALDRAISRHGATRIGIILGTSTSGIRETECAYETRRTTGAWPESFDPRATHTLDVLCRFTSLLTGLRGPAVTVSTACSSSAKVFLVAQRWLSLGLIDAALVGGVDSLCLSTLHGFDALQLLSGDPCRPFDVARCGISIGEAAGFMLLERDPAEIVFSAGGESSDAWHMSTPHPEGLGARLAMEEALHNAGLDAGEIGYVNAHGTATVANDASEAAALNALFGLGAVPVSSTKGITGHTLGAAGIVEAIITCAALASRELPPSANLDTPDPALGLDTVRQSTPAPLRHAMTNNFGFGGTNCSLIFSRTD